MFWKSSASAVVSHCSKPQRSRAAQPCRLLTDRRWNRIAFALSLPWAMFVNGFILGKYQRSQCRRRVLPPDAAIRRHTTPCPTLASQTDETLYPAEPLQNIGTNITQNLAPDIAYFYLQNTLGLSQETMWKITLEAGSVLGMTPRNLDKKVSLIRRTMNLSDEDVRVMLSKQPAILNYSADRNLAPTILFLVRALDLSKSELRKITMDSPSVLGYSLENLGKKVAFFKSLGYPDDNGVRELIVGTPRLLLSAVDTGLMPRMRFLLNEIEFSLDELRRLYDSNPRLLLYSLDGNLREKIVFFFILQLQMEPKQVRRMLLSYPHIMYYNLENHLKPIASYFMTELDFSAAELGLIATKFPRLFSYSLFKLKHVTGFLRYELELDAPACKRVIFQAPQVLGLDTEDNLRRKLDFLRDRMELTAEELSSVFSKMPTLACLSIERNLLPKLDFFEHTLTNQGDQLLKDVIMKQPALLGYSLGRRIRPRMEQLVDAGISPSKISVGISMSEDAFQEWLSSSVSRKMTTQRAAESKLEFLGRELGLGSTDRCSLISTMPSLGNTTMNIRFQKKFQQYMSEFSNSTDDVAKLIFLCQPSLLNLTANQMRLACKKLIQNFDNVQLLKSKFGLDEDERKALLLLSPDTPRTRREIESSLALLLDLTKGDDGVLKSILIDKPRDFFSLSLSQLKTRIAKLRPFFHEESDIVSKVIMDESGYQMHLSLSVLQTSLNFTQGELASIEDSISTRNELRDISPDLGNKIEFLLSQGHIEEVKNAILSRPILLSYPLSKLKSMPNILMTKFTKCTSLPFRNASKTILRDKLGLAGDNIEHVISTNRCLSLRDPQVLLVPKLDYLLSEFGGQHEHCSKCILRNPGLLDCSLHHYVIPRIKFMIDAGLNISEYNDAIMLSQHEIDRRMNLPHELNLTCHQLDCLIPMKSWLIQPRLRQRAVPAIKYLTSQLNGSIDDLEYVLRDEPNLLSLPLSKTRKVLEALLDSGCPPKDIGKAVMLTRRKLDQYCLQCYLCHTLGFQSDEADFVLGSIVGTHLSSIQANAVYLLGSVFGGSREKLKAGILQNPSLLKKSLTRTIQPRAEVLQFLDSVGLGCDDIDELYTMTDSAFAKKMLPTVKNWYPPDHFVSDKTKSTVKRKEKDSLKVGDIVSTLNDISSVSAFAYANETNREVAGVVHWR